MIKELSCNQLTQLHMNSGIFQCSSAASECLPKAVGGVCEQNYVELLSVGMCILVNHRPSVTLTVWLYVWF